MSRPWVPGVLLAVLVLAAAALIVAEFLTFAEVRVITAVPPGGTRTGGAHHGYALAVIGVAMIPLAVGAVRGRSRPAAVGLVVLSIAALRLVPLGPHMLVSAVAGAARLPRRTFVVGTVLGMIPGLVLLVCVGGPAEALLRAAAG